MPDNVQQLETRLAPATPATFMPDTIRLRVPPAFQAYLVRRRGWTILGILALAAVMPLSVVGLRIGHWTSDPAGYLQIALEALVFMAWKSAAKTPWYYEFGLLDAKLISTGRFDWGWQHLQWAKNSYIVVKRSLWQGLPALIFTRRTAYFWEPKQLTLVYSPDDEEKIDQIIPFMQRHGTLISEGSWYQP